MKRIVLVGLFGLVAACNKPGSDDCRKALTNMQHLLGTENLVKVSDFEGEVRRCKGGSTKESVQCAINAQTIDELNKCEFQHSGKKSDGE